MRKSKDGLYRRENEIFAFRYKDESGRWKEKYTGCSDRTEAKAAKDLFEKVGLYRGKAGSFYFRYLDVDGSWRERCSDTSDLEKAKAAKVQFDADMKAGSVPTEMADWRLDAAEKWWLDYRAQRIGASTMNSERYRLQHMVRILCNRKLREITNIDIDRYVTERLSEGVGAWSINREVLLWSQILRKAKLWRRLEEDYQPLKTEASDIGRALSRGELQMLAAIASTNEDWEAAFYGSVLAANTGLRGGEIKKLKIGSINIEKRLLMVSRSSTKSDSGARHIELNRDAVEAAARLLLRAQGLGATESDHYLMPKNLSRISHGKDKGKRGYDPYQHQEYWDTAWHNITEAVTCPKCSTLQSPADKCRKAECGAVMKGIKSPFSGLRSHDMRHTFVTAMVELGVPIGVIETMVGHINARMVKHYTHITSGAARNAVELLDRQPILAESVLTRERSTGAPN